MKITASSPAIAFSQLGDRIQPPVIVDLMARALENPSLLSLAAGFTDNAVLPRELVGKYVSDITAANFHGADPLQYGSNQGRPDLRKLTCDWMSTHPNESDSFDPAKVILSNGSQQSLYLAIQALCDPGDIVLVEDPSYFVCLEMLRGMGVRAMGIPCAPDGAVLPEEFAKTLNILEKAGERDRIKAIYLVSYFCNPSSRSLNTSEKDEIARVLLEKGYCIPVIEDAAYRELYFEKPHDAPSILSLPSYEPFPKLYLGTYTKPFATGLKVGYGYCSHAELLERMLGIKGHQDFGSAHFNQAIIEALLRSGDYMKHLVKVQGHYARKARVLESALEGGGLCEIGWEWSQPSGGLVIWLRGPAELDSRMSEAFCQKCISEGVLYVPGDLCFASAASWNCIRLSSGALPEDRLVEGASRFVKVAHEFSCAV